MQKYRYVRSDGGYATRWTNLIGTIEKPNPNERKALGDKYDMEIEDSPAPQSIDN